jgi:hypothetical protein
VHTVDVVAVCVAVVVLLCCAAVLARQRYMLRVAGAIPVAVHRGANRWVYGVARYVGGELRWYRSLGLGTRPSWVLRRGELSITAHRHPEPAELGALPETAVVVRCRTPDGERILALGEDAFTGFLSWVEASSPRA